jgi:hypothetical protein
MAYGWGAGVGYGDGFGLGRSFMEGSGKLQNSDQAGGEISVGTWPVRGQSRASVSFPEHP